MNKNYTKPKPYGGYELGKTYFNRYWQKKVTVIELHGSGSAGDWEVTVKWEDGRVTTHCTTRGSKDYEIVQ